MFKSGLLVLLWWGLLLLLGGPVVLAQRTSGSLGIGGQLGDPSGITLKIFQPGRLSYDFLAAWDADDFFYINVHGLRERRLPSTRNTYYFYGPGAFIGVLDHRGGDDDVVLGISATVGVGVLFDQLEFFGQITPRLALVPGTEGDAGGGVGFRIYF
jgi:hypothetical protein